MHAVQDTGNPVFDAVVNIICARGGGIEGIEDLHKKLLEIHQKEPAGPVRRIGATVAQDDA